MIGICSHLESTSSKHYSSNRTEMEPIKRARMEFKSDDPADDAPSTSSAKSIEQDSIIFRLNDDCFEAIFTFLTADDLTNLSDTCLHIHSLVKTFFSRMYPRKRIEIDWINGIVAIRKYAALKEVIQNVWFKGMQKKLSKQKHNYLPDFYNDSNLISYYIYSMCNRLPKLVRFENMMLQQRDGIMMKTTLENIESIELIGCNVDGIYENFLGRCKNLKHLTVRLCNGWEEKSWLEQAYPSLRSLDVQLEGAAEHEALIDFFRRNPHIKKFSCRSHLSSNLSQIENVMKAIMGSNLRLEELFLTIGGVCNFRNIYLNLMNISEQEQFKRLSLEFSSREVKELLIDSLNYLATMQKIHVLHITSVDIAEDLPTNMCVLSSLKELHLNNLPNSVYSARMLAMVIPNLEVLVIKNSVYFTPSVIEFIEPFIEHVPMLRKIVIPLQLWRQIHKNLMNFNNRRLQLQGACTVSIWVHSSVVMPQPSTSKRADEEEKKETNEEPPPKMLVRMKRLVDDYEHC